MGVRVELNLKAIAGLETAGVTAAGKTMEALRGEVVTAQVMPFDTGDMQDNQTFVDYSPEDATARLVTGSPQARRLYHHPEYNFQTVNNPDAGGLWLDPWTDGKYKDFVPETYKKLYKEEAGL